jgi:hypothetical protein
MDYWEQQFVIVCELCAGGHYTHQCEYASINCSWSYNQSGMQPSQYPSYPLQNQQYDDEPYNPWEIQPQQGQQFQYQYAPMQQQLQPPEFLQQQFHTDYVQQAEVEELKEEVRMMAESLKRMEDQVGQIANALLKEQENEHIPINLDWPFLATSETWIDAEKEKRSMEVQDQIVTSNVFKAIQIPSKDEDCFSVELVDTEHNKEVDQPLKTNPVESAFQGESEVEDDKEAKPEANHPKISESPENSVLKNQPCPHLLLSEISAKPLQDQEKAKANVYPPPPYPQHIQRLNVALWQGSVNIPHEAPGLEDLWNSQVRLKPSSEEDKLLRVLGEFKSAIGWIIADVKEISPSYCMHKILLEEGSKPAVEHQGRIYSVMEEGVKEEIIKWPMFGVHRTFHPGQRVLLYNSQFELFPGSSTIDSAKAKLDEFRHQAYENARVYKEEVKRFHDRHLAYKALHPP